MRHLIIGTLDFLAVLLVVVTTIAAVVAAIPTVSNPYLDVGSKLALVAGTSGVWLIGSVLVAGGVLALTEIARNSRRTVELLERLAAK